jgi:hypothetical protein
MQRTRMAWICSVALCLLAAPALADHHENHQAGGEQGGAPAMSPEMQAMMAAWQKAGTPGEQHRQLASSAGNWKATVRHWMAPGEPTVTEAKVKREMMLDGRVLNDHWEGNMMGMPFVGHGMTGYDNTTGKYWSTWNDNMSTTVMVSWGQWDDAAKGVVFEGTIANPMANGAPMKMRSISRHNADGTESFEMWEPHGPNGEMVKTMEATLVRQ